MKLAEYEADGRKRYERLSEVVRDILRETAGAMADVRLLVIQNRVKDARSLRKKMAGRGLTEADELEDAIKDLAGCRVIVCTNTDVQRLLSSSTIRDNFEVDWDRTKIHYPLDDADAGQLFISQLRKRQWGAA